MFKNIYCTDHRMKFEINRRKKRSKELALWAMQHQENCLKKDEFPTSYNTKDIDLSDYK